jgi:hypothetical protein
VSVRLYSRPQIASDPDAPEPPDAGVPYPVPDPGDPTTDDPEAD